MVSFSKPFSEIFIQLADYSTTEPYAINASCSLKIIFCCYVVALKLSSKNYMCIKVAAIEFVGFNYLEPAIHLKYMKFSVLVLVYSLNMNIHWKYIHIHAYSVYLILSI